MRVTSNPFYDYMKMRIDNLSTEWKKGDPFAVNLLGSAGGALNSKSPRRLPYSGNHSQAHHADLSKPVTFILPVRN